MKAPKFAQELFDKAERTVAYGEYRQAQEFFHQACQATEDSDLRCRSAYGQASASHRLSEPQAVLDALQQTGLPQRDCWKPVLAAEASLLAAAAHMALEETEQALVELQASLSYAAHALGEERGKALSASRAEQIISTHPDIPAAELLASAAMSAAEFYSVAGQPNLGFAWLRAAARVIGRSMSVRGYRVLPRIRRVSGILIEAGLDEGMVDSLFDSLPLGEYVSKAMAARQKMMGFGYRIIAKFKKTLPNPTYAELLESIAGYSIDQSLIEHGQADVVTRDLEKLIAELDNARAIRLAMMARYHLARLLNERSVATAQLQYQVLSFSEQIEMRDTGQEIAAELDPRIAPLLIPAIVFFNQNRPDCDQFLLGALLMLASAPRPEVPDRVAEMTIHHVIEMNPLSPSSYWQACLMLSTSLAWREAYNTSAFWAKMALNGLAVTNKVASAMYASAYIGKVIMQGYVDIVVDRLRRLGRLQEAAQAVQFATAFEFEQKPEFPWTTQEWTVREELLDHFQKIDTRTPLDFSEDALIHGYIADVERQLEAPADLPDDDFQPPPGVAFVSVAPSGNGVSLRLQTSELDWHNKAQSTFPEGYPLTFAVESLFKTFSNIFNESVQPDSPWPDIWAETWVEQISREILGSLPPFKADVLLLKTSGVFRFLPFSALGIKRLFVDFLPILRYPLSPVRREPCTGSRQVAVFSLHNGPSEVDVITKLVGKENALSRTGPSATRNAFSELAHSEASILHIATHCLPNAAEPAKSRLLLSDGNTIELGELAKLDFSRFDLITLATCASGTPGGSATTSAADLFHAAGARQVLTALWPVDEDKTAELMSYFYTFLLGPHPLSAAEALRQAQLTIRKICPHPYFWAAFQISGLPE